MSDNIDLAVIALRIIEKSMSKPKTRKSFSEKTKKITLKNQNYRCKACGNKSKNWDYDHIDGDSSKNSLENCQALCPNCHAEKTRMNKQRKLKLSKIVRYLKAFLKD